MNSLSPNLSGASLKDSRILVVDDAALNRELIVSYLQSAGFRFVETACDGDEALTKVEEFEPNLLILDLVMPRMNGTEVIRSLRSKNDTKQLPILVQTTISDPEQRAEAWEFGATDIVTKPIHRLELLSRVKVQLENAYLIRELETYQQVAEEDICQALEVQKNLLPSKEILTTLEHREELKIDSIFIPCRFLSGDVWGLIDAGPGLIIAWICDFAGKGIRAALHTFRLHTLINEFKHLAEDPEALICALNDKLVEVIPVGQFSTFMIGVIDLNKDTFRYVTASSTHPIVYYRQSQSYEMGDGSGIPLGVIPNSNYPLRTLPFPKGASLILYSDLFWEDKGVPGISLLPEALPDLIPELNGRGMAEVVHEHLNLIGEMSFADDLTLVEIYRCPSGGRNETK